MSLLRQEVETYEEVWSAIGQYGDFAPGEMNLPVFMQCVASCKLNQHISATTILDAGCGSAKGAVKLAEMGFSVTLVDITDKGLVPEAQALPFYEASLWEDLHYIARDNQTHRGQTRFDFVYCTDVLEHIPPQFTMLAVDQMLRVAKHGLFINVSLVPDSFGVMLGKSLHRTVESFTWWRDSLRELGTVLDARDMHVSGAYFIVRD